MPRCFGLDRPSSSLGELPSCCSRLHNATNLLDLKFSLDVLSLRSWRCAGPSDDVCTRCSVLPFNNPPKLLLHRRGRAPRRSRTLSRTCSNFGVRCLSTLRARSHFHSRAGELSVMKTRFGRAVLAVKSKKDDSTRSNGRTAHFILGIPCKKRVDARSAAIPVRFSSSEGNFSALSLGNIPGPPLTANPLDNGALQQRQSAT